MLWALYELDCLVSEAPYIQANLEIADCDDKVIIGTPPGIGKTCDSLINFALPVFLNQTLNMNQGALSNRHQK